MLVISDIGMPELDGYELMRRVRARPGSSAGQLPAIALTAYAREQDRRMAMDAGFQTHVAKPVEPAELLRVVTGLLQLVDRAESSTRGRDLLALGLGRADMFVKFEKLLVSQGVEEALRFLNNRTPHRFTGLYRIDPPLLRNLHLVDAESPERVKGDDAPLEETLCAVVGREEQSFTVEDSRSDERLADHPARDKVISYCGVPLRDQQGRTFGTLCHYDLVPCDIPVAEMPFLEAAAALLAAAVAGQA